MGVFSLFADFKRLGFWLGGLAQFPVSALLGTWDRASLLRMIP
jgi:hypothetical protein